MNKSKCEIQRAPSTTSSTANQYFLPYDDVILYMSKYLDFEDYYRGFIRVFWPKGEEDGVVRDILWHKSIHKFESTFFNGKCLKIEYSFDPERTRKDRVHINFVVARTKCNIIVCMTMRSKYIIFEVVDRRYA